MEQRVGEQVGATWKSSKATDSAARASIVPVAAVALYPVLVLLSRLVTEPALNVNRAFSPWPPLARVAPWLWFTWLLNLVVLAAVVPVVDRVLRRSLHPTTETKLAHG